MFSIEFEERNPFDGLEKSFTKQSKSFLVIFSAANLAIFGIENNQFQWNFTVIFRRSKKYSWEHW